MNMNLAELMEGIEGARCVSGTPDISISDVVANTNAILPRNLFVAIRGTKVDGHAYVGRALEYGASAVVSEKPLSLPETVTNIVVDDTRRAYALLCAKFFHHPSRQLKLIGVTGTNGKTTTTYLLESIFTAAGMSSGVIGTTGHRFGSHVETARHTTPDSRDLQRLLAAMVKEGVAACAMEVSSHAISQERVAGCHFDVALFTNVTSEHLDFHEHFEAYVEAKTRLFTESLVSSSKSNPTAVINLDDPCGATLAARLQGMVLTFGRESRADVRIAKVEMNGEGMILSLITPRGEISLRSPLIGNFNAENITGSIAAAIALNINTDALLKGVAVMARVPGRFETIANHRGVIAIVDYAHTPDALKNILIQARAFVASQKLIVVFGCGGDRDRQKRPVMGRIAEELADVAIVTSDNPRTEDPTEILNDIVAGMKEPKKRRVILNRREAIEKAVSLAEAGDVVLVAGKGHERCQIIGEESFPFDDREELERHL